MEMFFEILFLGLLGAAVIGILGVSVTVLRRLFKGQS
jgi:hypothetical protein